MKNIQTSCLTLVTLFVGGAEAVAGGVTIPGYGSQAQPRAGAFAAKADDPSAIFHNPAGLAKTEGTVVQMGVNLINLQLRFKREGVYDDYTEDGNSLPFAGQEYDWVENQAHGAAALGDFALVPLLAASSDLGLDLPLRFGAGVFAPGAGSPDRQFSPNYELEQNPDEPPPPGRYDLLAQEAVVIFPSLAAAYRIGEALDVGVRASWGFGDIRSRNSVWGLRNYEEWEGHDALIDIEGNDSFVPAFGFGVLYRPEPFIELGFNYRSGASVNAKGSARIDSGSGTLIEGMELLEPRTEAPFKCGPGGTEERAIGCIDLTLPPVATLAGRYIVREGDAERADIELDVQWEGWSASKDVITLVDLKTPTLPVLPETVIRHGFEDVWSVRLGGSYTVGVGETQSLSFRGGVAHETAAAPLSWTRLDQDGFSHDVFATGIAYDMPGWRFEASGGAVLEQTRVVSHGGCNPTPDAEGCSPGGEVPVRDRNTPDPLQPIKAPGNQAESPFNAGEYEQSYLFFGLGLTASF